jgi:hypothetical protein
MPNLISLNERSSVTLNNQSGHVLYVAKAVGPSPMQAHTTIELTT